MTREFANDPSVQQLFITVLLFAAGFKYPACRPLLLQPHLITQFEIAILLEVPAWERLDGVTRAAATP
jgi:hypothetical protein